ncbi:MAG: protein-L-isoaspartate(D-aspartate) O-methyltransferase [Thermoguttaceae bacterium]|jgi:protein-L-isoaspartate(D-aspartate) O-methyltransferase
MTGKRTWQWGVAALAAAAIVATGQGRGGESRPSLADARNRMVNEEIVGAGVKNARVIAAMRATPRHEFVRSDQRANAYYDMALPIGEGQTISPPFIVAYMTEVLDPQPTDKVLEIGTGSGYQAAVLSGLVREVYTIEIVAPLGQRAAKTLQRLRYTNVHCKVGDGYQGWPEHAPFDKIIVTCSPEEVPAKLVEQLKEGGRMVIPVGQRYQQTMFLMKKIQGKMESESLLPTLFVPMTGVMEAQRKVKPDPTRPAIENGDFEETIGDPPQPAGWHYTRQLEMGSGDAPSGKKYITFHNAEPGRGAQALQAFAVDGRKVKALDVSLQVKGHNIRPDQATQQLPMLGLIFYDENRGILGEKLIKFGRGTFAWQTEKRRIEVPPKARECILRIGMFGAVGELSVDDVQVQAAK